MDIDADSPGPDLVRRLWPAEHRHLHEVAWRMLRDPHLADDVVQEAFVRLARVERPIDDPRAWLTVVVRRLCLNRLDTAQHRRESPFDPTAPEAGSLEAAGRSGDSGDPADRVTLDDQVQDALAVVLDRLSPAERTAFVLHDVFALGYDEIGRIVGRSATACRQLASRARRSIRAAPPAPGDRAAARTTDRHRRLVERFVEACEAGDVAGLVEALDPEAAVDTVAFDGTPLGHGEGAERVAAEAVRFLGPGSGSVLIPLLGDNGTDVVVVYAGGGRGVLDISTTSDTGTTPAAIRHLRITVVSSAQP